MKVLRKIWQAWKRAKFIAEDKIQAKTAIKEADEKKELTGRKHYVLYLQRKYYVFTRKQIVNLKNKGIITKSIDFMKLDSVAFYITK